MGKARHPPVQQVMKPLYETLESLGFKRRKGSLFWCMQTSPEATGCIALLHGGVTSTKFEITPMLHVWQEPAAKCMCEMIGRARENLAPTASMLLRKLVPGTRGLGFECPRLECPPEVLEPFRAEVQGFGIPELKRVNSAQAIIDATRKNEWSMMYQDRWMPLLLVLVGRVDEGRQELEMWKANRRAKASPEYLQFYEGFVEKFEREFGSAT